LHLQPGDEIVYEIVDDRVILTRARGRDRADDPFRAFAEWSSEADARAYADL
jgi:antitoxin PrlF